MAAQALLRRRPIRSQCRHRLPRPRPLARSRLAKGLACRVLIGALAALTATASAAQGSLPFVLKQVGPGVYAAIDGPEHKAGSNAGFVIGDDGVLVVDG